MALKDLFNIPDNLSDGQRRWLKMCAAIPGVKKAFGDDVSDEDRALSQEANELLASHPEAKEHVLQFSC